jgi:hypothetical protein
MQLIKNQNGVTLLELIIASGISVLVALLGIVIMQQAMTLKLKSEMANDKANLEATIRGMLNTPTTCFNALGLGRQPINMAPPAAFGWDIYSIRTPPPPQTIEFYATPSPTQNLFGSLVITAIKLLPLYTTVVNIAQNANAVYLAANLLFTVRLQFPPVVNPPILDFVIPLTLRMNQSKSSIEACSVTAQNDNSVIMIPLPCTGTPVAQHLVLNQATALTPAQWVCQ